MSASVMAEATKTGFVEDSINGAPMETSFESVASAASDYGERSPQHQEESGGNRSQRTIRLGGYMKTAGGTRYFRAGPGVVAVILKVANGKRRLPVVNKPHDAEICLMDGDPQDQKTWDAKTLRPLERLWYNTYFQTGKVDETRLGGFLFNIRVSATDNKNPRTDRPDWAGFLYGYPKAQQGGSNAPAPTSVQPQKAATPNNAEVQALHDLFRAGQISATEYKAKLAALGDKPNSAVVAVKSEEAPLF